ncbi:MAG: shikimate kinase [Proteobacteria bacterium]|nr:shikimate kinase [Pseudomonadota bacterium]
MLASDRIIVLVGLMGSGKSRIGALLAKLLKVPFVDVDREIEYAANYTISEIFERFGEKEFRRGEQEVMLRLLSGGPRVLASGGGAFIQPIIKKAIKEKAISVWLKATLDTLLLRTSRTNHRPLLQGVNAAERLQKLMEERYPLYAEADITVVSDDQTPQDTAWIIKAELEKLARRENKKETP